MDRNRFIFGIVIIFVLFIGVLAWTTTDTARNFAAKCSELGGVTINNGQHWECLGVKNGNQ